MSRQPDRTRAWAIAWPAIVIVPLVSWMLTSNLGEIPEPWFDEGVHVNAAHTLATTGRYALTDASGLSRHDARVQVGPTVIVPVAAALRVGGPSMIAARVPIVVYGLVCLALAFLVTWDLSGGSAAASWLAVCWLAWGSAEPFTSVGFLSRNVLGEVPALAFLLAGLALLGRGHPWTAGLAWGLAAITKGQLTLLLPLVLAGLVAAALVAMPAERRRVLWLCAGAALPPVAWAAWQVNALGLDGLAHQGGQVQDGVLTQIFAPAWSHAVRAAGVLWRAGFLVTGLCGLIWAIVRWVRTETRTLPLAAWVTASALLLIWFGGLSVGWARYALYPVALTACLSAAWLGRLSSSRPRAGGAVLATAFLWAAVGGFAHAERLRNPARSGLAEMNAYIEWRLSPSDRVESWEWQAGLSRPEVFVRPSLTDIYRVTRQVMTRTRADPPVVQPAGRLGDGCADYLLEGPFSGWTGLYATLHREGRTHVEAVFDNYRLSRVSDDGTCRVAAR